MLKVFFDIGPLQEREFTGISHVTAKLAESLLGDTEVDVNFIYADLLVPNNVVRSILYHRNGSFFRYHFSVGDLRYKQVQSLRFASTDAVAGIYPNVKTSRSIFPVESQIIYDLSTLLVPQYHTEDTIRHHAYTLPEDLASNDLTFCTSEATRNDIVTYFGVPKDKTAICYPGTDIKPSYAVADEEEEPFILVLGTLEPRKNLDLVFRMLKQHPEFLVAYKVIVVGRIGWGEGFDVTLQKLGMTDAWKSGRLQFLGFVSEEEKVKLIQQALIMIYPSMFEGFGLPVLEALAAATPVVTSFSSSLPEVGEDAAYYCDPTDVNSLWVAILRALTDIHTQPDQVKAACLTQASKFSWDNFYQSIKSGLIYAHQQKLCNWE
jgi:glycosyltransferase involved in cell wall biosynthesis